MDDAPITLAEPRPAHRRWFALLIVVTAMAQALGLTLRIPTQLEANDISRWCTVWALLERGTYVIDECPWQNKTQDKVYKATDGGDAKHFYSSKPPLLPTIVAGLVYPFRKAVGVPLDAHVMQERVERRLRKEDPNVVGKYVDVTETPPPVRWPVYVFYLKPVIVLLNLVPLLAMLILYVRLLDRYAKTDWAWFVALVATAFATPLTAFVTTLNNHTVAAFSAFFAAYALLRIWELTEPLRKPDDTPIGRYYAAAGFFGAFCACNELPAAAFGVALVVILAIKDLRRTLAYFVPAALVPCAAFLATQYLATGSVVPVYSEFGTESYTGYEWSYWNTPLEMDWFDKHPEPKWVYLIHMLVGHHGIFSLTPIFLFALATMLRAMFTRGAALRGLSWLTFAMTLIQVAFYAYKTNNYGGSTQGLRWLFWVFPLWLMLLPPALEGGETRRGQRWLALIALGFSVLTVGYAMRTPWSHPWILDMLEHLNQYTLTR